MICDQVPKSEDLSHEVDLQLRGYLEKDFQLCYPSKWSILQQLRQSYTHASKLVFQLANDEINEELGLTFINFKMTKENWTMEVEKKLGSIIWCHLFKNRNEVGKALREGFYLAIITAPIRKTRKEEFISDIALLTPDCLKIAFSRSCSINPGKFMSTIVFENTINEVQFTKAIYEMLNAERMRLTIFITRLKFFGGSHISIVLLDRTDDPCFQASICFSQLFLPPYSSYDTMVRMIKYSTMDTSYGRA